MHLFCLIRCNAIQDERAHKADIVNAIHIWYLWYLISKAYGISSLKFKPFVMSHTHTLNIRRQSSQFTLCWRLCVYMPVFSLVFFSFLFDFKLFSISCLFIICSVSVKWFSGHIAYSVCVMSKSYIYRILIKCNISRFLVLTTITE